MREICIYIIQSLLIDAIYSFELLARRGEFEDIVVKENGSYEANSP